MHLDPHEKKDGFRVFLEKHEYETMIECASRDRAKIAFRLGGESSLRKGEAIVVTRAEIRQSSTPGVDIYFISRIWGKETRKSGSEKPRRPWVPHSLVKEIDRYSERKNIDPESPLYMRSGSTLQNDVVDARERAAAKTGNEDFLEVTYHDFRRYWATNLYYRLGLDIKFIAALGGWEDIDNMKDEYLNPYFDDVIQQHLAEKGALDIETGHQTPMDRVLEKTRKLESRLDELEQIIASDDNDTEEEAKTHQEVQGNHTLGRF